MRCFGSIQTIYGLFSLSLVVAVTLHFWQNLVGLKHRNIKKNIAKFKLRNAV